MAATETNDDRFRADLEFLECLANPLYLQSIAPQLQEPAMINYLSYLLNQFTQPEFALALRFPASLSMLHHLQDPGFRKELKEPSWSRYILEQTSLHWQHSAINTTFPQ